VLRAGQVTKCGIFMADHSTLRFLQRLDVLQFPLTGPRLIEASAGTGKTYTIATLYVRLLLGHGMPENTAEVASQTETPPSPNWGEGLGERAPGIAGQNGLTHPNKGIGEVETRIANGDLPEQELNDGSAALSPQPGVPGPSQEGGVATRPLDVNQILVVTFTEAATAELQDRIRHRVREALQVFLLGEGDPLLCQLAQEFQDRTDWAIRRLKFCLRQMDEAEIFTIHGFCNRLLQRHAFESGSAFDLTFETQDLRYREEAIRDFWRRRILPLDRQALELLGAIRLDSPAKLEQELQAWSKREGLVIHRADTADSFEQILAQLQARIERLASLWQSQGETLRTQLGRLQFNQGAFGPLDLAGLSEALDRNAPLTLAQWGHLLTPEHLRAKLSKRSRINRQADQSVLEHVFFQECAELQRQAQEPLRQALLVAAWQAVKERMAELKQEQNVLTPDDLLVKTAQALRGPNGDLLVRQVRARYAMALIDEFQDTDSTQYFIFERLFGDGFQACGSGLGGFCMIGDPKQAIYAFRGGDIFTYVTAKQGLLARHTEETPHLFTLDVNWRSSSRLVQALNVLFQQAREVFLSDAIPFQPVQPSPRADQEPLLIEGKPPCPLQLWLTPEEVSASSKLDLQRTLAQATAYQIAHWLNLARQDRARIGTRTLQAGDLAVLVRTQAEGALIQQALRMQGVRTVTISRASIFRAPEAVDLYQLLRAVAEPGNERLIRAAMGCSLFADTPQALAERWADEDHWEQLLLQFQEYHQLWLRVGVIPMVRQLLQDQEIYARLTRHEDWERRLTNLYHLAELLQQASREVQGMQGLLRWLQESISRADDQSDEQQIRLDSDDDLVKVVTIHKSKGLEYPVVFLPFAWSRRLASLALFHDPEAGGRLTLDLRRDSAHLAAADREALAEDVRLLYVALTRARHACFLGVAPYQSSRGGDLRASALGHVLFAGESPVEAPDRSAVQAALQRWVQVAEGAMELADLPSPAYYREPVAPRQALSARRFRGYILDDWRLASFSSLTQGGEASQVPLEADLELAEEEGPQEDEGLNIRAFPKGARAGTLMHEMLEALDFSRMGPLRTGIHADLDALVRDKLRVHGYDPQRWQPVFRAWLEDVAHADLGQGFALGDIRPHQRQIEMEFHVPVKHLNQEGLLEVLRRNDPGRETVAPQLHFDSLQGQLKGFVDMVFEQGGRYYLLDFKSNHLGMRVQDYQEPAMLHAARQHQYDLQYLFHSIALHRLLKYRLGKHYRYERHFGGVFYLFLRGMRQSSAKPYGVFHRKPESRLIEHLDAMLQGEVLL